jgi:hypothetical protein
MVFQYRFPLKFKFKLKLEKVMLAIYLKVIMQNGSEKQENGKAE